MTVNGFVAPTSRRRYEKLATVVNGMPSLRGPDLLREFRQGGVRTAEKRKMLLLRAGIGENRFVQS